VNSKATEHFWDCYAQLPKTVQRRADKAYALFRRNPLHPALRFKPLASPPNHYSVRINEQYRAVGVKDEQTLVWFWIGTHNEFDNLF
jgi:hypothetical protein